MAEEKHETVLHAPVTVTIDIDQLLHAATDYVQVGEDEWAGGDPFVTLVAGAVAKQVLDSDLRKAVRDALQASVEAKVAALIDARLEEVLVPTNEWGETRPGKEPKALRDIIIEAAEKRLGQQVGSDGKPADRYGSNQTYLEWQVSRLTSQVLDRDFSAQLNGAKQIKARAQQVVADKVAAALANI